EYLLATYPPGPDTDRLKEVVKKILAKEIDKVLKGENKDVEKRHRHYVINSPSSVYSNDTLKNGVSEQQAQQQQQHLEKSIDIITKPSIRKRLKNNKNMIVVAVASEQQSQENQNEKESENNNIIIVNRRRKKKLILD
ncbi:MAG TPA: hypothetical protein VJP58_10795, partial [Candidatus Nitrosocosmicus sp.]|nr:hypothetical protein [Candidatus Nitrosocosmicus sp.]